MSDLGRATLFVCLIAAVTTVLSYKGVDDLRAACMSKTCSTGFTAWSYGPDRVNPINGKSIGRGSDSACYCVLIAAEDPK